MRAAIERVVKEQAEGIQRVDTNLRALQRAAATQVDMSPASVTPFATKLSHHASWLKPSNGGTQDIFLGEALAEALEGGAAAGSEPLLQPRGSKEAQQQSSGSM